MRIVHVNQFFIPGLSYQENILPHEQAKLGHEVWILTSDRLPNPNKYPGSQGRLPQGIVRENSALKAPEPACLSVDRVGAEAACPGVFARAGGHTSYLFYHPVVGIA